MDYTPIGMKLATWTAQGVLVGAQVHLFVWAKRALQPRLGASAKYVAGGGALFGLALVLSAAIFPVDDWLWPERGEAAGLWRYVAAVWAAGSAGGYLVWLAGSRILRTEERGHVNYNRRRLLQAAAATPFAAAGYGVFIGRNRFEVIEKDVAIPNLPADLVGRKIVQITDLHTGPYFTRSEVARAVSMANECRADIAVVTGDLITQPGDPLDACIDELAKLHADAGVFGCMGNHEEYAECRGYATDYALERGIRLLRHRSQLFQFGGAKLNLAGVDYQRKSRPYLPNAASLLEPGALNVLLSHNPDVFPKAAELGYDLVVSGHTHGGQITMEIVEQTVNPGRFYTRFVAGGYDIGPSRLYVSRGLGTINLPMRIGALPEVSLLRLTRA